MIELSEIGLPTKVAVIKEAKAVATHHFGTKVAFAEMCLLQGMFSCTVEVTMKDKKLCVVQFRSESGHEEYSQEAHEILGDLVPVPIRVVREGSPVPYTYIMPGFLVSRIIPRHRGQSGQASVT